MIEYGQPISVMPNTFLQQRSLEIIGDLYPQGMGGYRVPASVLPGKAYAREMPVLHQGNSLVECQLFLCFSVPLLIKMDIQRIQKKEHHISKKLSDDF